MVFVVLVVFNMLFNKFMSEFSNQKLGKGAQDGFGGVHVIEQSAAGDAGLVDRGGDYKDKQDMKSPSVQNAQTCSHNFRGKWFLWGFLRCLCVFVDVPCLSVCLNVIIYVCVCAKRHIFCFCVTFAVKSKIIKSCMLIMNLPQPCAQPLL